MPVSEAEIWEASALIGIATSFKHGVLKPEDEFWANVPEKWVDELHPKLITLPCTFNDENQEVYGPAKVVAMLTEAAQERGLSLPDFWQKLEGHVDKQVRGDPDLDEDWLSRSLFHPED